MDDLIIISDGNEIAYAKTVLDLFRTQVNEETVVRSALGDLYNAELYLAECLESLVHQTMAASDLECLAVTHLTVSSSWVIQDIG